MSDEDVAAEVTARLNRLEMRLEDLEGLVPLYGGSDGDASSGPAGRALKHQDLDSWMVGYFASTYSRPLGGEWRWCPQWREHPEAVERLTALWRSWEKLRRDEDLGMAVWFHDHLDAQLVALLGRRGPFSQCSPTRHEATAHLST